MRSVSRMRRTGGGPLVDAGEVPVATDGSDPNGVQMSQPDDPWGPHLIEAARERWSLFEETDLQHVGTRRALITALRSRYRLTEDQATAQVLDWAAGR